MMTFQGPALRRTADGVARACTALGCKPAALAAVIAVETGGSGFDSNRRPRALFEPHIFYALLKDDPAMRARAVAAGLAYPRWGTRPYPSDSYAHIQAAGKIDAECALRASSWGLPQILGRNFAAAGYSSAASLVDAFRTGEDEQLAAMARFVRAQGLASALACEDWATFARGYNGAGYAKNRYDRKLRAAFDLLSRQSMRSTAVVGSSTAAARNAQIAIAAAHRQGAATIAAGGSAAATIAMPVVAHRHLFDLRFGVACAAAILLLAAAVALVAVARAQSRRADVFSSAIKGV